MTEKTLIMETNSVDKITKAKKRVKELKGFYTHLTIYIFINLFLMVAKLVGYHLYGNAFMGPFGISVPLQPLSFGALGCLFMP